MVDDCIFCKIVNGEIPCEKIWEDEKFLVFLDAFPTVLGHTLVIPKKHLASYLFDMDEKDYIEMLLIAKKIAKAIDKALNLVKTGMIVEGLEVNHVHIKLLPLDRGGLKLKPLDPPPSKEKLQEIAEKIKSCI